jgi:putative hydrolase of the HAD superfamily
MLPKGILFDLDDTIIAYTPVAEPTWRSICEEFSKRNGLLESERLFNAIGRASDWYWSDQERHRIGRGDLRTARRRILEMALGDLDIADEQMAREIADAFTERREEEVYIFERAEETLEYLKGQNISLALMTNGEAEKQRNKVRRFRLDRYFKSILIEGELGFGKPDRAFYILALDELGLGPGDVWAVGDNLEWDVLGPQRLGIHGIWNDFSVKGLPEDSPIIPDRIIHNISELME